jgi:hypothetical protein
MVIQGEWAWGTGRRSDPGTRKCTSTEQGRKELRRSESDKFSGEGGKADIYFTDIKTLRRMSAVHVQNKPFKEW